MLFHAPYPRGAHWMTPTLTRRRLLKGSLTGLVAGISSGCADQLSGRRVVVVGAGLSGLNAALILERWGFDVQVVEARERVGGRLWTLDHLPGSPEGGGNVMGSNYGRTFKMAHDLEVYLQNISQKNHRMGCFLEYQAY